MYDTILSPIPDLQHELDESTEKQRQLTLENQQYKEQLRYDNYVTGNEDL